ncbi:Low-density lipoprotein receptor [Armadillidium vulgare]|nr:Low-density lipoprotein receptor [Armadillidium vulgare]
MLFYFDMKSVCSYILCIYKYFNAQESCEDLTLFLCTSGECISKEFLCDGSKECIDGSDETQDLCKYRSCSLLDYINEDASDILSIQPSSTEQTFRCNYGACISRFFLCDGIKHCVADGSDETEELCKSQHCHSRQFQCKYGACINRRNACDNRYHCYDGSDETAEACRWRRKQCIASRFFKCKYGACKFKCNAVIDCLDESDESEDICGPRPNLELKSSLPIPSNPLLIKTDKKNVSTTTARPTVTSSVISRSDIKVNKKIKNKYLSYLEENQASSKRIVKAKVLKIQFNSENPNDPQQFASVSSIVLHPQYSGGQSPRNDVALLFLKENLEKEHGLSSACLDKEGTLLNIDAFTFNRTFGQSLYKWETFKQTLDTSCFNLATMCSRHLNIGKNQFCAINADSTLYLHQGSSGGPYMITTKESREKWAVAGVVSNSIYTTECGTPHTVFSSVSKHYDWIFNCGSYGKCSK